MNLQIGDEIISADGTHGVVDAVVLTDGTAEVYHLTVDEAHTYFVGDGAWLVHNDCPFGDDGGGGNQRPKTGKQAIKEIQAGETEITVRNRKDAEEVLLNLYIGTSPNSPGFINTTGLSATEAKKLHGRKQGTYHWDENIAGGSVQGHGPNNPHGNKPHLQIHTHEGDIIRIFFSE